jgi:tRNA(Ile)-lysidine synthase
MRNYPASDRYLVGVSGGRDSVALLDLLLAAGFHELVVCHVDHGLRGAASAEDARFVASLAAERGLPCEGGRVDVRALARKGKVSIETAARDARCRFFGRAAARWQCPTILLAHHADDQAETFLFNLLRGAGPAGLAAMATESARRMGARTLRIVRPLLGVWREEIDRYVAQRGLAWREDASNADPTCATRNGLRHEAMPVLERVMGRGVRRALWRAADLLGAEEAWLTEVIAAEGTLPAHLPREKVAERPLALQRRLLRAWLLGQGVPGVGYEEVERVRTLLEPPGSGPAKVNLPDARHGRRRAGKLFVE